MELGKYKLAMRPKKYLTREFVVYQETPEAMDDVITEEQDIIETMPSQAPGMDNVMPAEPGMEDPRLRQIALADGGVVEREGFAKKGIVKLGRAPDPESLVGQIRTYLEQNFKKGDKVDVNKIAKLFNYDSSRTNKTVRQLGLVPMNNEDKIAIKVQDFIDNYITKNNKLPEQKIVKEATNTDAQVIRRLINKGRIQNIQLTRFEINEQVAKYILNTKNPTLKGIKKTIGSYETEPSKVLTRIYKNSLTSLTNKLNKIDEGRSVFGNFNINEVEKLKYKVRQIPGFESYYEREITDLIADAYKDQPEKKSKALKKVAKFKSLNKELKKIRVNLQLDHPLSYNFYKQAVNNVDPEELIRVKPIPERVNTFKMTLDNKLVEVGKTLQKNPNNKEAMSLYNNIKSIANEIGFDVGKISPAGQIIDPQAAKIGDKPLWKDIERAPSLQNKLRSFVQAVINDPRMQSLDINLNELSDLAKLPKINPAQYNKVIKNFAAKSGKLGIPLLVGYNLLNPEEASAAASADVPVDESIMGLNKTQAGVLAGAGTVATKTGRKVLGKILDLISTPLTVPFGGAAVGKALYPEMSYGEHLKETVTDPAFLTGTGFLMRPTVASSKNIANLVSKFSPAAGNVLEKGFNLGMNPKVLTKFGERVLGPIAGLYTAGEQLYNLYSQNKEYLDSLTQEERDQISLNFLDETVMDVFKQPSTGEYIGEKNIPDGITTYEKETTLPEQIPSADDLMNKYAYGGRVKLGVGTIPKAFSWVGKRIQEINKLIKTKRAKAEDFIDEIQVLNKAEELNLTPEQVEQILQRQKQIVIDKYLKRPFEGDPELESRLPYDPNATPRNIRRDKNSYGGRVGLKDAGDPKDKPILPINPMMDEGPQDPSKREFIKGAGGIGLAGLLVGTGLLKLGKSAAVSSKIGSMIKNTTAPSWMEALITKVMKEGTDSSINYIGRNKFSSAPDNTIVTKELKFKNPETGQMEEVRLRINQDKDTINVDYLSGSGNTMADQGVTFEIRPKTEIVYSKDGKYLTDKKVKGEYEFHAYEAEPRVVNWDGDIEFDAELGVKKIIELNSDLSGLKSYVTGGKGIDKKVAKAKQEAMDYIEKNPNEYLENAYDPMSIDKSYYND